MAYEGSPLEQYLPDSPPHTQELLADERPQDECGVLGVWAPGEDVARILYAGLKAQQHRGQSGAGLSVYNPDSGITTFKNVGLVDQAVPEAIPMENGQSRIDLLYRPVSGVGHTRYSTAESEEASQPFDGFAHNGHVEDAGLIAEEYEVDTGNAVSDSWLIKQTIEKRAEELGGDMRSALAEVLPQLEGAYCLTINTPEALIGVRDPWGFHPLVMGRLPGGGRALASETVGLEAMGAEFERDIEPGEIVIISDQAVASERINRKETPKRCAFEFKYIAKPQSVIDGIHVLQSRINMGRKLAEDFPADADVVVGVPDTGLAAAEGYSQVSGLPLVPGIAKNPNVRRSFLERGERREAILRQKFIPNMMELAGLRVVLIDDSMIKGNTMRILIGMLHEAGAEEIHFRSAASRYVNPCFMGMDTRDTNRLIARNKSDAEIAEFINAKSVGFNYAARIEEAIREAAISPEKAAELGSFCLACTDGDYPFKNGTFAEIERTEGKPELASFPIRATII